MAEDFNALKTAVETDPRYATALTTGANGDLTKLLLQDEAGKSVPAKRAKAEMVDAIADGIPNMTADQVASFNLVLDVTGELDFNDARQVTAVRNLFVGNPQEVAVNAAIDVISTRQARFADAFGYESIGRQEIKQLIDAISTSASSVYKSDTVAEAARQAKAIVINRIGAKIRRLRDEGGFRDQPFVDFRNMLYTLAPLPSTEREDTVDAEMIKRGLTP